MTATIKKTELKATNKSECIVDGETIGTRKSKHDYNKCFIVRYRKDYLIKSTKWAITHYTNWGGEFGIKHAESNKALLVKYESGNFGTKLDLQVLSWHKAAGATPKLEDSYELVAIATL